ncbi:MAG: hypothetical protein ACOYOJ_00345 [Alsobacter sp.]
MITLTVSSPPDYTQSLRSQDVRELCIRAENIIRLWARRSGPLTLAISGATPAQKRHVEGYLQDVEAELRANLSRAAGLRLKR